MAWGFDFRGELPSVVLFTVCTIQSAESRFIEVSFPKTFVDLLAPFVPHSENICPR